MSILDVLTVEQTERLRIVQLCEGLPISDILVKLDMPVEVTLEGEKYNLAQRKGSLSVVCEWMLTGERGDNKAIPDWGVVEIKTVNVRQTTKPAKYSIPTHNFAFVENMRTTKINFNTIQTETFAQSSLALKSVMVVLLILKDNSVPLLQRKLVGVGVIDLRDHTAQLEADFNYVKRVCVEGRVSELSSCIDQPCQLIKTYSSGSKKKKGNINQYTDGTGIQREGKGKAFYLFKDALVSLYTPLILPAE